MIQPPLPALLAVPFVLLFGPAFQQQILSALLGAGSIVLTYLLAKNIGLKTAGSIWGGLLIGFGSCFWYLAATGSVWYLGQVSAYFFLTAGLVEATGKKRPFIVGIAIGAAYLSRLHTILAAPVYLFLLRDKLKLTGIFRLALGSAPFALFNFGYNFVRFGTIFDKGYFLIPGILDEPWFAKGMLHYSYIWPHLQLLLFKLPNFLPTPPYVQPSWYGLAIWITTPAFIFALNARFKNTLTKILWLACGLILTLLSLRGGTGWTQFGYRYAVDFYPFLVLLTLLGVKHTGLKKIHWVVLAISIVVNLWGVLWINKFGWVSY